MDTIAASLSDLHCGLRLALLNPATRLLDANGQVWTPSLTVTQKRLWSFWLEDIEAARALLHSRRLVLLLLGDLTQGLVHWAGVWGTTLYDHITGALACLEPWLELEPAAIRLVEGTEVHTGEGATEQLIARELSRLLPRCDVDIAQHYKTSVNGVLIDYAHHGPGAGIRQWTSGNVAGHYLKSLMLEEMVNGDAPARVVLRAHVHRAVRRTERLDTKAGQIVGDIVVNPGYCGINPHGRKVTQSAMSQTNGCVLVECGKDVEIHQLNHYTDLRREEAL